jgi:hypothetical protein
VALALGEDRDEHVGARDLFPARGLDMNDGALNHPLEPGSRFRILTTIRDEVRQFRIHVLDEIAAQDLKVDIARPHDGRGVLIVDERQEQMFEGGIFMPPLPSESEGSV